MDYTTLNPHSLPAATQSDFDAAAIATLRQIEADLAAASSQLVWSVLIPAKKSPQINAKMFGAGAMVGMLITLVLWFAIDHYALNNMIRQQTPLMFWGFAAMLAVVPLITRRALASERLQKQLERQTHTAVCVHIDRLRESVSVFQLNARYPTSWSFFPKSWAAKSAKLPPFALPQHDEAIYAAVRERVQNDITALCGIGFYDDKAGLKHFQPYG